MNVARRQMLEDWIAEIGDVVDWVVEVEVVVVVAVHESAQMVTPESAKHRFTISGYFNSVFAA